jgi:hypothetical protein
MNDIVRTEAQEVATVAAPTPMEMIAIAVENGADPDKLEKLMDLQERWEKRQAEKAYIAAMLLFKSAPPTLYKDKQVQAGKAAYSHISLEFASRSIGAALQKQGIQHDWVSRVLEDRQIEVTCILTHKDGHVHHGASLAASPDGSGSKNSVQAIGSTTTYLQRYTLLMTVGLSVPGMDDDGVSAVGLQKEEFEEIVDLLEKSGVTAQAFCKRFKIDAVQDLPALKVRPALLMLKQRAKQQETGQ